MGFGLGILLVAVGAILAFAVHVTTSGVDIHTVGWILLGVGAFSILLSMIFWSSWAGPGYFARRRVYYDGPGSYDGTVGAGRPGVTHETRIENF
jgi:hypothetical protein